MAEAMDLEFEAGQLSGAISCLSVLVAEAGTSVVTGADLSALLHCVERQAACVGIMVHDVLETERERTAQRA
ncbi:MAG: hypothetical protein RQ833_07415 [Sphingomonadaceae bacterium]|nr:hypothetical protein [Sphingomonadaceae bacterium]